MKHYDFAIRTDVKSSYASIDHDILARILQKTVKDAAVRRLLQQFLRRTIDDGGNYEEVRPMYRKNNRKKRRLTCMRL